MPARGAEGVLWAVGDWTGGCALLVRDGLSNPEVGARLFLSPRTVEWHLRKIFGKLSISSRKQLRDALPHPDRVPAQA